MLTISISMLITILLECIMLFWFDTIQIRIYFAYEKKNKWKIFDFVDVHCE